MAQQQNTQAAGSSQPDESQEVIAGVSRHKWIQLSQLSAHTPEWDGTQPATIILSAPQGWGKTSKAKNLAKQYGCQSIVDEWTPAETIKPGALHLTNIHPKEIRPITGASLVATGWKSEAA